MLRTKASAPMIASEFNRICPCVRVSKLIICKTGDYNFTAVTKAITMLAPDIIVNCQRSVMRNLNNMISRLTKSLQDAGSMRDVENHDKTYKVFQAFHPSCFAKGIGEGKLSDKRAVRKAALLELSFRWAVNAIL